MTLVSDLGDWEDSGAAEIVREQGAVGKCVVGMENIRQENEQILSHFPA